jgi:dipeptidyl aminopeptidase/acylaminoacyl peptidase
MALDWSADGRFLLYREFANDPSAGTQWDLWVVPLAGDRKPFPFIQTPFREEQGQFSPDTQWIAYTSNESGNVEVYVQSFPAGRAKWRISNSGGDFPRWRRDEQELYYMAPDGTLMSVAVRSSAGSLEFGVPDKLFKISVPSPVGAEYPYDVVADGQRFLAFAPAREAESPSITVMLNWHAGLSDSGK